MSRRLLWLSPILAAAACTGLYLDKGNAYPCDFSEGPGVRDAVCIAGDVCGSNNVCQKYLYEGPRFEGPATVPTFDAGGFFRIHPQTLDAPIRALVQTPSPRGGTLIQLDDDGSTYLANSRGQLKLSRSLPSGLRDVNFATVGTVGAAVGISSSGKVAYQVQSVGSIFSNDTGADAVRLRVTATGSNVLPVMQIVTPGGGAGEVTLLPPPPVSPSLTLTTTYPVTNAIDVGLLVRQGATAAPTPVVLTRTGVWLEQADGGFEQQSMHSAAEGTLRFNWASTVMAEQRLRVLATWQVGLSNETPRTHTLEQPWADCTPCPPSTLIEGVAPLPPSEGLGVEVMCRGLKGRTLLRVTGSSAVESSDLCESDELPLPLDDALLHDVGRLPGPIDAGVVVVASSQRGISVGGLHGEVWSGETFSALLPRGLERVPLDVMRIDVKTNRATSSSIGAITDRYLAALQPPGPNSEPSGFRRIDALADFGTSGGMHFLAAVHGVNGWALQNNGVVTNLDVDEDTDGGASGLSYGPRLTSPSGEPIRRSIGGEAFAHPDGGLVALFLTGDDGLYLVANPEDRLGDLTSGTEDLTPQLQPEPSVPIRSLALERTPLGTGTPADGGIIDRARGYLVTSRNVYEWKLGGTPSRWTSTPLVLAGGEPVEVWFDTEQSALGRVGYSDGTIFTLPGGYQLANPLPGGDGRPVKVVDYENFGGWPVALASTGLFIARWPQDANGKLLNRFPDGGINRPMDWTELSMPNGDKPWLDADQVRGKLFVSVERNAENLRVFKLLVFLDSQVLQLGEYTRK